MYHVKATLMVGGQNRNQIYDFMSILETVGHTDFG